MTTKHDAVQSNNHSGTSSGDTAGDSHGEVNLSLVVGTLAGELEERVLPSGTRAVSFSLTVRVPGVKTTSVPMVWFDPPRRIGRLKVGDRVVASGSVVRRFYRSRGGLGSATEVVVASAAKTGSAASQRVVEQIANAVGAIASGT